MKTITNHYFKDQDPKYPLLSGLPLPKDPDGIVRNIRFVDCSFHPNCKHTKFEGCEFEGESPADWPGRPIEMS
jgi:hypothetical protein